MNSSFIPALPLSFFNQFPTMALKLPIPFPLFAPQFCPNPSPPPHSSPTEIRFSRWNNANAEKFETRRRSQQEIEDQIRRQRRFDSVTRIANLHDSDASPSSSAPESFRSLGTPSSPSNPSIPGRKSKYSKKPNPNSPPVFRQVSKTKKTLSVSKDRPLGVEANVSVSEDGVSYVIDGAPFEFKYSYTETPKLKPIKLREPPFAPFGPTTMPRPWTGRAPLPPSKKKLPEFDSFRLPPANKKGVKPVQAPGPFLPGSGPKYVMSREEILGEPLTAEEIKILVQGCLKSSRQLNIGRDGLTHNMLDNIHSHWKRRRVCKIKCKGVCTVDMGNVKQQLEEKTGGKIIYSRGGVLYLYRGRNYNYKTRPRFPLMLWKPATPMYPRLIQHAPDGLTLEEATEMRKKGRKLIPICKLGKNGVYYNLVRHVKEAFEECELVRINCQGMNGSDFRKIGAKLKDLVPCVLISFESEHILIWRGRDWKSSLPSRGSNAKKWEAPERYEATIVPPSTEQEATVEVASLRHFDSSLGSAFIVIGGNELDPMKVEECVSTDVGATARKICQNDSISMTKDCDEDDIESTEGEDVRMHITAKSNGEDFESRSTMSGSETGSESGYSDIEEAEPMKQLRFDSVSAVENSEMEAGSLSIGPATRDKLMYASKASEALLKSRVDGVLSLLKQAIEKGSAVVLDDSSLDADIVYQRTVALSQSSPPGPVFRHQPRKVLIVKSEKPEPELEPETRELEVKEVAAVSVKGRSEKKVSKTKGKKDFGDYNFSAPQGSLGVDELAKLLA